MLESIIEASSIIFTARAYLVLQHFYFKFTRQASVTKDIILTHISLTQQCSKYQVLQIFHTTLCCRGMGFKHQVDKEKQKP